MYVHPQIPAKELKCDLEEYFQKFTEEVAVLGLLGDAHQVEASTEYTVDADVQLVCKYLRAYDEPKINRMYQEGECVCIMVQFSIIIVYVPHCL